MYIVGVMLEMERFGGGIVCPFSRMVYLLRMYAGMGWFGGYFFFSELGNLTEWMEGRLDSLWIGSE
jgi:hypothetical protein